jgi:hypothetical protein
MGRARPITPAFPDFPAHVSGSLCQALASIDQSVAVRRMRSQSLNLNRLLLGDEPNCVGHSPNYPKRIPAKISSYVCGCWSQLGRFGAGLRTAHGQPHLCDGHELVVVGCGSIHTILRRWAIVRLRYRTHRGEIAHVANLLLYRRP